MYRSSVQELELMDVPFSSASTGNVFGCCHNGKLATVRPSSGMSGYEFQPWNELYNASMVVQAPDGSDKRSDSVLQCRHWRAYRSSVPSLGMFRLMDKQFFSASTGANICTVLQCKHW
jgi:hypothetical protein